MTYSFLYASCRQFFCAPTVEALSGGSITSTRARTYTFWIQGRTRAGSNVFGDPATVSVVAGQKIRVTIPAVCRRDGEDIHYWIISVNTSIAPENAVVVATCPAFDNSGNPTALPATIELTHDAHLAIGMAEQTVSSAAALPTNKIKGMRRYVSDESVIKEWDGITWKTLFPQSLSAYLLRTSELGGSDRPVSAITDDRYLLIPEYSGTPDSTGFAEISDFVGFWLRNDSDVPISAGTLFSAKVLLNGREIPPGLIKLRFKGFVNTTTGERDISDGGTGIMPGVDAVIGYSGNRTGLKLWKPLPKNFAYWVEVAVQMTAQQQTEWGAIQGSIFRFDLGFFASIASYDPLAELVSSFISILGKRRRIVPNGPTLSANALDGSGCIQGFIFNDAPTVPVAGLSANQSGQRVVITTEGNCYVSSLTPSYHELRAIVSTVPVSSVISAWYPVVVTAGQNIQLVITYPQAIRSNYPDIIAGTPARFNATKVHIYLERSGEIRRYSVNPLIDAISDTFTVGGALGDVSPLPTPPNDLGLFSPSDATINVTAVSGTSALTAGSYNVAVAFYFEGTLTGINHDPLAGCIVEREIGGEAVNAPQSDSSLAQLLLLKLSYA